MSDEMVNPYTQGLMDTTPLASQNPPPLVTSKSPTC